LFANLDQHCEPLFGDGVGKPPINQGVTEMQATKSGGSKRGFAAMDPAKQREIASKGGKASHGGGRKSSSSR
jgi:general stress protein YciG